MSGGGGSRALIAAAVALADMLARENAALEALDLTQAAALLEDKAEAMTAFLGAAEADGAGAADQTMDRAEARAVAARLGAAAAANRTLLERAIQVQGRVIELVVAAVPRPEASALGYSARGAASGGPRGAMALVARA